MGVITSDRSAAFPARTKHEADLYRAVFDAHEREKLLRELCQIYAELLGGWAELEAKRTQGFSSRSLTRWGKQLGEQTEKALS